MKLDQDTLLRYVSRKEALVVTFKNYGLFIGAFTLVVSAILILAFWPVLEKPFKLDDPYLPLSLPISYGDMIFLVTIGIFLFGILVYLVPEYFRQMARYVYCTGCEETRTFAGIAKEKAEMTARRCKGCHHKL